MAVLGKKAAVEQKPVSVAEQKVASNVEVKTTPTGEEKVGLKGEEEASLPKCIGPGCENNAQPDSVYCGNDCILRHAAAAMKSITDDKEPKQKDKEKAKCEKAKSTAKVTRITYQTVAWSCEWPNQRSCVVLQVSRCLWLKSKVTKVESQFLSVGSYETFDQMSLIFATSVLLLSVCPTGSIVQWVWVIIPS